MRFLLASGYWIIIALFLVCAAVLVVLAGAELWINVARVSLTVRFSAVLRAIGLLTVAVATLELSQTILEEEIRRRMHISAPTRVRRFMSRFLVVVVVGLSVETLVTVFEIAHRNPLALPQAAALGIAVGAILAGWGVFIRCNTEAERLEPEAMQQAKREDAKVDS